MANTSYKAPLEDIRFTLDAVEALKPLSLPAYADFSPALLHSVLDEAARFAEEVLAPLNSKGDLERCTFENNHVRLPSGFVEAYKAFYEQGWNAAPFASDIGGQGLPQSIATALQEIWHGANLSFALMPLLTQSAVHLLAHKATPWMREHILPKLVSGEWTGTMCMTEPQAGSDVGACRAIATPHNDGTYRIKGTKIFISYGEHNASSNIIHIVLARLPDAPAGSQGLSVFMVPKFLVKDDGSLGARNDVKAISIEHKLGMHASPTAVMAFGDDKGAVGTIIGKPGEGLKIMFMMMNAARFGVGLEGLGIAEYATQQAKDYATSRIQGRALASANKAPAPIAEHPDVKRMLTFMEAHTSALRGLAYYSASLQDWSLHADSNAAKESTARADLLTPIVKAHTTGLAFDLASLAIQVHGGIGYVEETGVAQLLRDIRVTMIYEGTNGIQALDLVGRKLGLDNGQAIMRLMDDVGLASAELTATKDYTLMPLGNALAKGLQHFNQAYSNMVLQVQRTATNTDGEAPSAASASSFLTLLGLLVEGFIHAKMVLHAHHLLRTNDTTYAAHYLQHKIDLARFFLLDTLLDCISLKERVLLGDTSLRNPGPGPS